MNARPDPATQRALPFGAARSDEEPVFGVELGLPADSQDGVWAGIDDATAHALDGALGADAPAAWPSRRADCVADADEEQLTAWLQRIVERDECALASLYDATVRRVYGLVLRIVRRPALAEEAVEDAYLQVWSQAVRFDGTRGRALSWILGMARSRAIDTVRREARFQHDSLDDEAPAASVDAAAPADELLQAAHGYAELQRALLQLQAQPRQLVAMAFFRGLSHEEIAAQMALPLGTVKSQIRRAMISLRDLLGPQLGEGRAL